MGDLDGPGVPGAFGAVELPPPRVLPRRDRRRHRLLTGTSGLLLFICLFMPAVDGCQGPVTPLDAPAVWPPYLYGFVFAFAALARTKRGIAAATIALRSLSVLTMLAGVGFALFALPVGIFIIAYGSILLATIGWSGYSERRLAATAIAVASTSSVWFALWSCMPSALLGARLSVLSAVGLLVGSMLWAHEALSAESRRSRLPSAIVH